MDGKLDILLERQYSKDSCSIHTYLLRGEFHLFCFFWKSFFFQLSQVSIYPISLSHYYSLLKIGNNIYANVNNNQHNVKSHSRKGTHRLG
jgi:hypothetical protein